MRRAGVRRAIPLGIVAIVLALCASVAGAGAGPAGAGPADGAVAVSGPVERSVTHSPKTFAGVAADVPTATRIGGRRTALAGGERLLYQGGTVLHANRTWAIFWAPQRSGLSFDPGYTQQIAIFLARVAADSHRTTNVYSLSGQYRDLAGPAAYNSIFGGSVLDQDPLPGNGCRPSEGGPPWHVCLSDAQLQHEIARVIRDDGLPNTARDIYFLITPDGLGSCAGAGPDSCALGGPEDPGGYCGYHSSTPDGSIVYAVIPYNAVPGHCQSGNPRPNASTADPAISTLSHEHNEMVTDPLGDAWIDANGEEEADLCATSFGPALGGAGGGQYNESIAGAHYWLQEEWSDRDGACEPRARPDRVGFVVAHAAIARPQRVLVFTARGIDAAAAVESYTWFFGDGQVGHGRRAAHVFTRPGVYRVVVKTVDGAGDWAYCAHMVVVGRGG